jgi:hypothetical protein
VAAPFPWQQPAPAVAPIPYEPGASAPGGADLSDKTVMQTTHPIFRDDADDANVRGRIVVSVPRPQTNNLVSHLFAFLGDPNSDAVRAVVGNLRSRIQRENNNKPLRVGDFINLVHQCAAEVFGPMKGSEIRDKMAALSNSNFNVASSGQLRDDQKLDPSYLLMILR